jgi:hypothetical protein
MADRSAHAHARDLGDGFMGVWGWPYERRREMTDRFPARWDPNLKAWRIPAAFATEVFALLHAEDSPPHVTTRSALGRSLTEVFRPIPSQLRMPTYRALAKVWHPDAGGDHDCMTALNDAWSEVSL